MPKLSDSQIREVVERIFDNFEPEKVIVFGSQVTGDTHKWSDLDLIVVDDRSDEELKQLRKALYRWLADLDFAVDVIVMNPERYRNLSGHPSSFIHSARKKGALEVYEPQERTEAE